MTVLSLLHVNISNSTFSGNNSAPEETTQRQGWHCSLPVHQSLQRLAPQRTARPSCHFCFQPETPPSCST